MTSKCFKKTVQFVDVHQETRKKQSYMDGRLTDSCRFASSQSKWSASKNQTLRVRNDGKNHLQQKDHCIVDLKVPASHVDGLRCLCHGVSEIKQAFAFASWFAVAIIVCSSVEITTKAGRRPALRETKRHETEQVLQICGQMMVRC